MKYPKNPLAQTLIQLFKVRHIKHVIISPGSRNAPLTIGFTEDSYFSCYSIVDERCAAFFALGIAQKLQAPVAIVCTSGSALLNYYPAIAEAFYSDLPLIVVSADRPEHLINIGDGQTINQPNVFQNHVICNANLKPGFQKKNELEINKAINSALLEKGPVHINIPFDEPLYELVEEVTVKPQVVVPDIHQDDTNFNEFIQQWNISARKLILVGSNQPHAIDQKWLNSLADDECTIVFSETTSNIHHSDFFPSIDKIIAPLNPEEFQQLQPDLLITMGGLIVSKKIKAFLRTYKPKTHWHIDEKKANNTFFCLDKHLKISPNLFFSEVLPNTKSVNSSYKNNWERVKLHRRERHARYLKKCKFSDLKVFEILLSKIPKNSILQLSNSSTIRYAQLFDCNDSIEIFCNRGTSGIDGCTSTAIGHAVVSKKQVTLITGDLSFLYDSNALWNNYTPINFRIIVINNGGGGIFRILPGHKNTKNFDTFFETKHKLSAKQLSEMYGYTYHKASNEIELTSELDQFFEDSKELKLLEIFTPRTINDDILINYFKYIK